MKRTILIAVGLLASGALVGCGSSSDAGGSGSSGGAITVAFIGSTESQVYSFPEASDAVKARVDAANAKGGINGRKVKFVTCNDKADPNEAVACVRKVSQDGAVAVVGGISAVGDSITSALQSANIIYTGNRPLSPGEQKSPIAFPLVGGGTVTGTGAGIYAADTAGCKSIYVIEGDVPGNRSVATAFKNGVKSVTGSEPAGTVTPATATDYAPAASAAADAGADCLFFAISVPEMPKAIPAFRAALPDATIMTTAGNLPAPIIKALGDQANGIVLADTQIPPATTGNGYLDQFQAEMKKYVPSAVPTSFAVSSWMGADLLMKTLAGMDGDISAASVLKKYNSLGAVDGHGVIGDFTIKGSGPDSSTPRLFNMNTTIFSVVGGVPTLPKATATFTDVTDAIGG